MLVTELGIVIEVSFEQFSKARFPMVATEFPKVTVARALHSEKASLPILVTELGISIEVSARQ